MYTVQVCGFILSLLCASYTQGKPALDCTAAWDRKCDDLSACYTHAQWCDGVQHCQDWSDEPPNCNSNSNGSAPETHLTDKSKEDGHSPEAGQKSHSSGEGNSSGGQSSGGGHSSDDGHSDGHNAFKEGDTIKITAPVTITLAWLLVALIAHLYLRLRRPLAPKGAEEEKGIAAIPWMGRTSSRKETTKEIDASGSSHPDPNPYSDPDPYPDPNPDSETPSSADSTENTGPPSYSQVVDLSDEK